MTVVSLEVSRNAAAHSVPRLSVSGLTKSFDGIHALRDVSFDIAPGEIHALLGENGAGKSTLVKIVSGLQLADRGEIALDGVPCQFRTPMEARRAGVVAVYQDPKLFPHLDVAENIFMGVQPLHRLGTIDRRLMYERADALLRELDADLSATTIVAGLSIGEMQFIEFARAMADGVDRLLFLDEPTAALTPSETERLFRVVRRLRDRGASIVFISHRLEELEGLVDTVTVLRDGQHVATKPAAALDETTIVRLMVGRSLDELYPGEERTASAGPSTKPAMPGPARLSVRELGLRGVFDRVSFEVYAGEVVAMAGLVGAGRSEIAHTLFGITPPTSGQVFLDGQPVVIRSARQMLALGLAYLPEDRDREGLIPSLSILRNLVMPIMGKLSRFGIVNPEREHDIGRRYASDLQIRAQTLDQAVATLSGGNRQKVVLGKWLAMSPSILILDEPTHGIDVGTKAQVHAIIRSLADRGLAILVISSDLPEVLRMGDRVIVVADGRITATLARHEATQESVMGAATQRRSA